MDCFFRDHVIDVEGVLKLDDKSIPARYLLERDGETIGHFTVGPDLVIVRTDVLAKTSN